MLSWLDAVAIFACMACVYRCDVISSHQKLTEMFSVGEPSLLEGLNKFLTAEYALLEDLRQFLEERSKVVNGTYDPPDLHNMIQHPNAAYLLIKHRLRTWDPLLSRFPRLKNYVSQSHIPEVQDLTGAQTALMWLQLVYQLDVGQMLAGNYLGYPGPPLEPRDAFAIGKQAFVGGFLDMSLLWLQEAVKGMQPLSDSDPKLLTQAKALLGRAHLIKAHELYTEAQKLDKKVADVAELKAELGQKKVSYFRQSDSRYTPISHLCSRDKELRVETVRPFHVCRYKAFRGPSYLRYKEEILSVRPYVSLFHQLLHDQEIEHIKNFVQGKMARNTVGMDLEKRVVDFRTSYGAWIGDVESAVVAEVSRRVGMATALETSQQKTDRPSSAEDMQVVNYGLGGHYTLHNDDSNDDLTRTNVRIATFLMYLSDVEKGGHTVFSNAGISVAPQKGMGLFWYNFTPDCQVDGLSRHAGCPVLIGEKWICTKWIWIYGNTFRRPCGSTPNATQLDIERLLSRGHA